MEEELEDKLLQMSLCPPQLMVCPKRNFLFNQIYIKQSSLSEIHYIWDFDNDISLVGKNTVLLTIIKTFSIHLRE